jgi:hypothetical protein
VSIYFPEDSGDRLKPIIAGEHPQGGGLDFAGASLPNGSERMLRAEVFSKINLTGFLDFKFGLC